MKKFYDTLSEKDRRRYAVLEVMKLAYGAKQYISDLLDCDYKTIERELSDLENEEELKKKNKRCWGRKKAQVRKRSKNRKEFFGGVKGS